MTLPYERTSAVLRTPKAIVEVFKYARRQKSQKIAHVPVEVVDNLFACLRHYPTQYDMQRAAKKCPEVFGKEGTE